jgi:hypothetical protein
MSPVSIFALILHPSGKDRLLLASYGKGKTSSNSVAFWVRRDGLSRGYFDSWIPKFQFHQKRFPTAKKANGDLVSHDNNTDAL